MDSIYSKVLVQSICKEIKKVWEKSHSLSGTVLFIYVALDTMSFLNMGEGKTQNEKSDFIMWVTNYLKTDSGQQYQYLGKDVYGARCAKLHSFSSFSNFSGKNDCKLFGYHDGSEHIYEPSKNEKLVLISVPRFMEDFFAAVQLFIKNAIEFPEIKKRIDSRILKVSEQFDVK